MKLISAVFIFTILYLFDSFSIGLLSTPFQNGSFATDIADQIQLDEFKFINPETITCSKVEDCELTKSYCKENLGLLDLYNQNSNNQESENEADR